MANLGWPEILIILLVVVILFGAKKLPDAARSLGRSMRIFKSEVKEMGNDDSDEQSGQPQQLTAGESARSRQSGADAQAVLRDEAQPQARDPRA